MKTTKKKRTEFAQFPVCRDKYFTYVCIYEEDKRINIRAKDILHALKLGMVYGPVIKVESIF